MALRTMYPPQKDSPSTFLLGDITAMDTLLSVGNAGVLPQTVPFPLTIGVDKTVTETVLVTAINLETNQLTVTRGFSGDAILWNAGVKVARVFTAKDLQDVQSNISEVVVGVEAALDAVDQQSETIDALVTTIGDENSGLVKDLADEVARSVAADEAESSRAIAAEGVLNVGKVDRTDLPQVITDWVYSADGTKVLVTITRYNASTKQTTQYTKTLPVVSAEAMGVMTPEAYTEITTLRNDVTALQQQGGRFIGVSFATKNELNSYAIPSTVKMGDYTYVLDDETKSGATTRYVYNGTAFAFTFVIDYDPVGLADSSTPGLVKSDGGTTNGKVFVETDGTMSVIGWSALNTALAGKVDTTSTSVAPTADLIPIRTTEGQVRVGTPALTDAATTKAYVDAADALKLNVSDPVVAATESTVPLRTTGGQVRVGTPVLTDAAATKAYVDAFNTAPTAGGTATAITVPTTSFLLTNGGKLSFVAAYNNNGAATTINTYPLYKPGTTQAPTLIAGMLYTVWFNGSYFFLQASAGDEPEGTAVAGDVLAGKTFSNNDDTGIIGALQVANGFYAPEPTNSFIGRTSAADNNWYSVCYGNGLFVAVANYSTGTGNRVMTSPDGITWTIRTSAADNAWYSVCYGNGLFVAVAGSGTGNRVMTSPDGITWTIRTSAADNQWSSVCYGNGLFVAVANNGTGNRVMTSPDGITWTIRTSAADNTWYSVCYGNGLFVAVAYSGTGNRVMTSPDGITWTIRTSAADNAWFSVCYGNGLFVAVAGSGTGNRVMTAASITELAQAGTLKTVQSLGAITATYSSETVVTFALKTKVPDPSILTTDNIVAQFTRIQKVTTANNPVLTWTYNSSTGILTCTASANLFASGTTIANIYVMM